jgi:uncharacterized SAM-dependent methyltransferase
MMPSHSVVTPTQAVVSSDVAILDIRRTRDNSSMVDQIRAGLRPEHGKPRTLPTMLLYDADGLRLFEEITHLPEYYLTNQEINVLQKYAASIAERIKPSSMLVELGSGYDSQPQAELRHSNLPTVPVVAKNLTS